MSEHQEIAGLRYTRLPQPGETVFVFHGDTGNNLAVEVWAGPSRDKREVIGWLQIGIPPKPDRYNATLDRFEGLARAAEAHWRAEGFEVI